MRCCPAVLCRLGWTRAPYDKVFAADLWGKRTAKARRRNCAVLPLILPHFTGKGQCRFLQWGISIMVYRGRPAGGRIIWFDRSHDPTPDRGPISVPTEIGGKSPPRGLPSGAYPLASLVLHCPPLDVHCANFMVLPAPAVGTKRRKQCVSTPPLIKIRAVWSGEHVLHRFVKSQ